MRVSRLTTTENSPTLLSIPGFREPVVITSVGQIDELMEYLESREPKHKRTKEYKEWKSAINSLAITCNKLVGFSRYRIVK